MPARNYRNFQPCAIRQWLLLRWPWSVGFVDLRRATWPNRAANTPLANLHRSFTSWLHGLTIGQLKYTQLGQRPWMSPAFTCASAPTNRISLAKPTLSIASARLATTLGALKQTTEMSHRIMRKAPSSVALSRIPISQI